MEKCNFACTSCYLTELGNRTEPLPFEKVRHQLDTLRRHLGPGAKAQITSGEVTLLPVDELGRIVRYALEIGLDPMVMTNGERFRRDPEYLVALVRDHGLRKIGLHIDTTQKGRRWHPAGPQGNTVRAMPTGLREADRGHAAAEEAEGIVAQAKVVELSRGGYVYREGSPAQSCYVIVRGAIETSVSRDRRYQLSILGPGRICGANSLITDRRCCSDARARSAVLLLGFDRSAFRRLYSGDAIECLKFQRMISQNQLQDRRVADNLLSTLVSQDYV